MKRIVPKYLFNKYLQNRLNSKKKEYENILSNYYMFEMIIIKIFIKIIFVCYVCCLAYAECI